MFACEAIPGYADMSAEEFAGHLHRFFTALPRGPRYAVELRNKSFLGYEHFDALSAHNVESVFSR